MVLEKDSRCEVVKYWKSTAGKGRNLCLFYNSRSERSWNKRIKTREMSKLRDMLAGKPQEQTLMTVT